MEQTVPFLAGPPQKSRTTERRAWVRHFASQDACCQPLPDSTTDEPETGWLGRVQDLSTGGIALLLTRRFEPGTALHVELAAKGEGSRPLLVRVIHATPESENHWLIGCAFACPLSEAELQTFLQE
jgi:hypothetical protein